MKIFSLCGSLRKESYNLKLLQAFGELLPSDMTLDIHPISDVPLFNEDLESVAIPAAVNHLAEEMTKAEVVLFAAPEYNYSISGVLKNTIDWLSRHPQKPFTGKLAAIIGASQGRLGTARAQYHLRQVGVFLDVRFLNRPEVMVSEAYNKFAPDGKLVDEKTREQLLKLVQALKDSMSKS